MNTSTLPSYEEVQHAPDGLVEEAQNTPDGLRECARMVGLEVVDSALESAMRRVKDQVFCVKPCKCVRHKSHATRTRHQCRSLSEAEKTAWVQRKVDEMLGDSAVRAGNVRKQKRNMDQEWLPPNAGLEANGVGAGPYIMGFGKYRQRKLTVEQVNQEDPGYLCHLVASMGESIFKFPGFQDALVAAGLWLPIVSAVPGVRRDEAMKVLSRKDTPRTETHREVLALRKIQEEDALAVLDSGGCADDIAGGSEAILERCKKRQRRQARSSTEKPISRLVRVCLSCGSVQHRTDACPFQSAAAVKKWAELKLWRGAFRRHDRKQRLQARLKYSVVHQRLQDDRPSKRARCKPAIAGEAIFRLDPYSSVLYHIAVGLFDDLEGKPCPRPKCQAGAETCFTNNRRLRALCRGARNYLDITIRSVRYCCSACHKPCQVTYGNALYPGKGGGLIAANKTTKAFWNCIHRASATFTALELGVNEKTAQKWYRQARVITASDAISRQAAIVFGRRGNRTVDMESDETVIKMMKEEGSDIWWFYILFGFMERSNPCTLWLKSSGIKKSEGEPRCPQLEAEFFEDCLDECFTEDTHANLFTDGAPAFGRAIDYKRTGEKHVGIQDLYQVNHSEHEWTRPEPHIVDNWSTLDTRAGYAGTQDIDKTWDLLKEHLPNNLSIKSPECVIEVDLWVRHAQWHVQNSTVDPWPLFCQAAAKWRAEQGNQMQENQQQPLQERVDVFDVFASEGQQQQQTLQLVDAFASAAQQEQQQVVVVDDDIASKADHHHQQQLQEQQQHDQQQLQEQQQDRCPACDKVGCHPLLISCPYHCSQSRISHPDAALGDNVPHIAELRLQRLSDSSVLINGAHYDYGRAGCDNNNCLLYSLRTLLGVPHADVALARRQLMLKHPKGAYRVRVANFLSFQEHCMDALKFLMWAAGRCDLDQMHELEGHYSITCIDFRVSGNFNHGDAVGAAPQQAMHTLFLGRQGENHFFPMLPRL